jgi:hypothetical protein
LPTAFMVVKREKFQVLQQYKGIIVNNKSAWS